MVNIKKQYEELFSEVDEIKNLDLSFKCINSITENKLVATFYGHSVAGSYVYAHQVAPNYEKQLEIFTNVKTRWNGDNTRKSGMFKDTYEFTFFLDKIIDKNKKELKGRNIYFDGTCAFTNEAGITWAYLYSIVKSFNNANNIDKEIFINSGLNITNNIISFNKTKICEIIKIKDDENIYIRGHNTQATRTNFCAYFDVYISDKELETIYFNLINNIVEEHIKNNYYTNLKVLKIFEKRNESSSNDIIITLNNFTEITIQHIHLHLISSNEFKQYIARNILEKNYLNNYTFINNDILENSYDNHTYLNKIVNIFSNFENDFENYNNESRNKNEINGRKYPELISQNLEFKVLIDYIVNDNTIVLETLIKKGYFTPYSFENKEKLYFGFNQLDLLLFSKSDEMFELLSNWIYDSSLSKGFYPIFNIVNNLNYHKTEENNLKFKKFFSNNIFKYINFLVEKNINLLDYEIKNSLICNFKNIPMFYFIDDKQINIVYKLLIKSLKNSKYINLLNNEQKEKFSFFMFKQISNILDINEVSCFNKNGYSNIIELLNLLNLELEEGVAFVLEDKINNNVYLSEIFLDIFIKTFNNKLNIDKNLTNTYNYFRKFNTLKEISYYFKIINKINNKDEMVNFLNKNFTNHKFSFDDYHSSFFINENFTTFEHLKSTSIASLYTNDNNKLIKTLSVECLKLALKKYGKEFTDLTI